MRDQHTDAAEPAQVAIATDSHGAAPQPSGKPALLREADLLEKMFWNIGEVAFIARVGVRTVWRLVSDPKSKFPKPHRLLGRTLFGRDEVLAYMAKEATR
jgi:predicted DNA-binding transcriptional regulator AlpA